MKKISYVLVSFCLIFLFSACSNDILKEYEPYVSDMRENYFHGQTDSFYVSFCSGVRESPYNLDGQSKDKVQFGIVTVVPKKSGPTQGLKYVVSIDNEDFSGEFEQSPFDDSYAGDINKKISDDSTIFVSINDGGKVETAQLKCLTSDFNITSSDALKIALNEVQNEVKSLKSAKNFEIYVKLVTDITQKIDEKFWIVMFLDKDGNSISVLINPSSGECEVKKV